MSRSGLFSFAVEGLSVCRQDVKAEVPLSKASDTLGVLHPELLGSRMGSNAGEKSTKEAPPPQSLKSAILTDGVKMCAVLLRATAVSRAAAVKALGGGGGI